MSNSTTLAGEVTAKNQFVQEPPPWTFAPYQQLPLNNGMALATTPATPPQRQLMTAVTIKLDNFNRKEDSGGQCGGSLDGSAQITFNNVEALAELRAGDRILITVVRPVAPVTAVQVTKMDDVPLIRPNETWAGEDGKQRTAADLPLPCF